MKSTFQFFSFFFCLATAMGACGTAEDNPCAQSKSVFEDGQLTFCEGQDEDCEYCACKNHGLFLDIANATCITPPEEEVLACEGIDELAALACLKDRAACEQDSSETAKLTCQSEYLQQNCILDSDCKYDLICPTETGMCSQP